MDRSGRKPITLVPHSGVQSLAFTFDLELTTMVLCVPDSVMEVASLPKAIETWVGLTHGATPAQRLGKPNLLFLALTKFDRTLEKAGDRKETFPEKLAIRFAASLSPFSKVEPSWVRQWWPRQTFRNLFLIRNPTVQFRGVVEYDGKHEVRVVPGEEARLADLREAFVSLPATADHFAEPGAAWDALMALDDGGAPTRPPATPTVDDAACDRLAGNRFDGDHPVAAGFTDEIFALPQADRDIGLAACDPSLARTGADRRFTVQRGRLLAHRALMRLAAADAKTDMEAAVALWRHGERLGSAYAANLLGAYQEGTFNRPGHSFVTPDDRVAHALWKKAMEGGNFVAERNYAAQLLAGKGVAADPAEALVLLRDAAAKADLHASGVVRDEAAGWPLVVAAQCVDRSAAAQCVDRSAAAQCVDRSAAALVERAIADGTRPASAHHACR